MAKAREFWILGMNVIDGTSIAYATKPKWIQDDALIHVIDVASVEKRINNIKYDRDREYAGLMEQANRLAGHLMKIAADNRNGPDYTYISVTLAGFEKWRAGE